MKIKNLLRSNHAVAGVIEALLLIALVAIILSIIQLNYVPQIMEQKEAEHMDEVANQFSYLKSVIDLQIMTEKDVPISSPVTLGSRELPYFVSTKSYGQINIIGEDDAGDSNISISTATSSTDIALTSIKYTAFNAYYLGGSDLLYVIEGGNIFLKQSEGGTVLVQPIISVSTSSNTITINYTIPSFKSISGKKSTSGYKDCFIRTNYTKTSYSSFTDVESISIYSDYLEAWNQSLNDTDAGLLWKYYDTGFVTIGLDDPTSPQSIVIAPVAGKTVDLELTIVEIGAQTGPGIIYRK